MEAALQLRLFWQGRQQGLADGFGRRSFGESQTSSAQRTPASGRSQDDREQHLLRAFATVVGQVKMVFQPALGVVMDLGTSDGTLGVTYGSLPERLREPKSFS